MPEYPSDEIPRQEKNKSSLACDFFAEIKEMTRERRNDKERLNVPVIGFIFCAFARSFEASSHSFVSVRGGGGANDTKYEIRNN